MDEGLQRPPHSLLRACGLPAAWAGRPQWRILDTAFGSGQAFLPAWQAWRDDPQRPGLLHYVGVIDPAADMQDLLDAADDDPQLQSRARELAAQWQGLVPGFHRIALEGGRVLLTACVGALTPTLRELAFHADAVFLGNVDHPLGAIKGLTRLCRRGAVLSSRQASPQAARDLRSCGWQVSAAADGLTAHYAPAWEVPGLAGAPSSQAADCVVIGAGLAGAAAAASLARRGWSVRVLDAAARPASGASALPIGLLAPHQSPDDNPLSRLSRAGVRITLQEAQQRLARGIEWERTGVLEWRGEDQRLLPALGDALQVWSREASATQKGAAGIAASDAAWWHENAGWIEPAALVRSWLREPGVQFTGGVRVRRIVRAGERWSLLNAHGAPVAEAALVVVAAALDSMELLENRLQLHPVRGQVTWAPHDADASALPPFPVNGHGHFVPRVPLVERNAWITGSTYGRGDADASLRSEDIAANLQRVGEVLPRTAAVVQSAMARGETRSWSGVRCASSDRRPLVGELEPGLWVSTAMGSRGLTFAALCAELLAARMHDEPLPLETRLAHALDAARQPARSG